MPLLFAACSEPSVQKAQDPRVDSVDKLFSKLDSTESPGIAILVVRDGELQMRRCYGMANLEHKVPITPDTVFDIASVSKQFCGLAVSMLIEKGEISLQDDIRTYIPELPDFGHTITIDHLVHHTSGIRDWPSTLALAGWQMDDVISFEQILTMAFNQQDLNFTPGNEYSYSNTGYNLLAEMVKRVTGKTFRQWTDENIFQPLGMKDTHFHDDHTEVVPNKAYGYVRSSDGTFRAVLNGLTALGSSSLYTTINDLAKWVMNLDDPKIGGKAVLERMVTTSVLNSGKKNTYAFGLGVGEYRGLRTLSHGGSWASFRTYLVHFPDQRFSVVTLLNYSPSNSSRAAYEVVDIYLADELKPRSEKAEPEKREPVQVPLPVLDEYVGMYRLGPAWYVSITRDEDQLFSHATVEKKVPMTAQSHTRFWVEDYRAAIVFQRNNEGQIDRFLYRGMTCPKIEAVPPPSLEQLKALAAEYVSEELKTFYTIALEGGKLVAKHRSHGTVNLTYAYKDDFRGGAGFMRSVEFYHNQAGEVAGFRVTQNRNRNQRFIKQSST